jgi:hypothetical protein
MQEGRRRQLRTPPPVPFLPHLPANWYVTRSEDPIHTFQRPKTLNPAGAPNSTTRHDLKPVHYTFHCHHHQWSIEPDWKLATWLCFLLRLLVRTSLNSFITHCTSPCCSSASSFLSSLWTPHSTVPRTILISAYSPISDSVFKVGAFQDDISGSHGGEYEDISLMERCTVQFGRYRSTFKRRGWWWRQYAPLKCRSTSTRLHGAISQNVDIFILAAVRTWNLTQH